MEENYEEPETLLDLPSKYFLIIEFNFDAMLYSNLGNETSDGSQIKCSRGPHFARLPQVPHQLRVKINAIIAVISCTKG